MNPNQDLENRIKTLEKEKEDLAIKVENLTKLVKDIKTVTENHTHAGDDGSAALYDSPISLKSGSDLQTGRLAFGDRYVTIDGNRVELAGMVFGEDSGKKGNLTNQFNSFQFSVQNLPDTDGGENQTFMYAFRKHFYNGKCVVNSTTRVTQNPVEFGWAADSLVGHYLTLTNPNDSTDFESYRILSNTDTSITVDGAFTITGSNVKFEVFMPVYFGSADYPWRRLYTTATTAGGLRFGVGNTAGGQNGLLYMDEADGRLKFRRPSGTVDTV